MKDLSPKKGDLDPIETASRDLLDMDNLGALNPDNIGLIKENHVAEAKRVARETEARPQLDQGARS